MLLRKKGKYIVLLLLSIGMGFASGCKEKNDKDDECLGKYPVDRLLRHYADAVITPDYQAFQSSLNALHTAFTVFAGNPTEQNLDSVRSKFRLAYLKWQFVEPYEFGPAETAFFRNSMNNFPLNEAAMETKLRNEDYDFSSPALFVKGFPALDYLLFGYAADITALVDTFSTSPKVLNYTSKVIEDMKSRTDLVTEQWVTGGFASTFKSNTGLAAGQSFSMIVNTLNEHFEILRRKRIGIPSGVLTLNFPNPEEVEGLYSQLSLALARASLDASERYFMGDEGEGLENALDFIQAQKGDQNLSQVISGQYSMARTAMDLIPETLSESVTANSAKVVDTYNALSPLVVLMKSDMPSVMCIAITYVDNPSDSD